MTLILSVIYFPSDKIATISFKQKNNNNHRSNLVAPKINV